MSNQPHKRGGRPQPLGRLGPAGSEHAQQHLIPVSPSMTIEEIVAQVRASDARQVELLVPNNTKALQSLAGCELLKQAAAESSVQLTLFTSDEMTAAAADRAKLDIVPVGGAIVGPPERPRPSAPVPRRPDRGAAGREAAPVDEDGRTRSDNGNTPARRPVAPNAGAADRVRAGSGGTDFLTDLQAFDQAQAAPPAAGVAVPTPEGALLFDAPGDLGVPRAGAEEYDAWAPAFDEMGETMAAEPAPQRVPSAPRRAFRREVEPVKRTPPASGGSPLLSTIGSIFPRPRWPAPPDDGVRTRRPEGNPAEPASRTRQSRRLLLWPLAIMALVAVLALGAWVATGGLRAATAENVVILRPAAAATELRRFDDVTIPVSATGPQDETSFAVQGMVLAQPVNVLVEGEAISQTVMPVGRASGTLILRNRNDQPLRIPAGTAVWASNGVQFTVDADSVVEPATVTLDGITYGRGQVTVTAGVPGAAGNIPAGTITAIPGLEGTLRVEHAAFTGGSDQEVPVVRTEDVNRVLPAALSQLYGRGLQALGQAAAGAPGLTLSQAAITPTLESLQQLTGFEMAVFPPIGGVADDGTFTLELRATFSGVAEPADRPLQQQIEEAARRQLVNYQGLSPEATIRVTSWQASGEQLLVDVEAQPPGAVQPIAPEVLADIKAGIAGKPREEAIAYLESLREAGTIGGFSQLPASWTVVPDQIEVQQEVQ